jgi:hypothetical protein
MRKRRKEVLIRFIISPPMTLFDAAGEKKTFSHGMVQMLCLKVLQMSMNNRYPVSGRQRRRNDESRAGDVSRR